MPLIYPFDDREPAIGSASTLHVGHGINWLKMPLDLSLQAVNVWCIPHDDGVVVFDTGLRSPDTAIAWREALSGPFTGKRIDRIYITHGHADHCGMAGWLAELHGARLHMSRSNFFLVRSLIEDSCRPIPSEAIEFYRCAGWDEAHLDHYRMTFGALFGHLMYPLPASFASIADGHRFQTGEIGWETIFGQGHIHDHCLYYSAQAKVLISGDQILPRISSNVSVYPQEPCADPLTDWIETLLALKRKLPEDVLVLPSHGRPFYGLHERIDELLAIAENGLTKAHAAIDSPKRAVDLFPVLFQRAVTKEHYALASGESLAHLACLRRRGIATCEADKSGVNWWSRMDAPNNS